MYVGTKQHLRVDMYIMDLSNYLRYNKSRLWWMILPHSLYILSFQRRIVRIHQLDRRRVSLMYILYRIAYKPVKFTSSSTSFVLYVLFNWKYAYINIVGTRNHNWWNLAETKLNFSICVCVYLYLSDMFKDTIINLILKN